MLGKYLGIDITEDSMIAVLVKSGLQEHRIIACAAVPIETTGGPEAALAELLDQISPEGVDVASAIPNGRVSFRNLSVPFKDIKKIRQIIAYELETMLPFPIDDLLVDFTVTRQMPDQTDILAAAVNRPFLSEFIALYESQGVTPEIVEIRDVPTVLWLFKQAFTPENGLFLDIGLKNATLILFLEKRIVLIRQILFQGESIQKIEKTSEGIASSSDLETEPFEAVFKPFCKAIQNTLMAFVDQTDESGRPEKVFVTGCVAAYPYTSELLERFLDLPVKNINMRRDPRIHLDDRLASLWKPEVMDNALALALRDTRTERGFNFRKEEFQVKKQYLKFKKEFRTGAFFLLAILFLFIADLGVDYYSLKKHYQALDQKVTGIFRETFPDVTRIVDPVQQMQVKVNEIKKTAGAFTGTFANANVLDLLGDISQRIPDSLDVKVTRMVIDPESLQFKGTTDTFNTVDTIKKQLEASAYFANVAINSANVDRSGQEVQFEIRSQLAK